MKRGATKVRALQDGKVVAGFAGVVSDAFTLLEKFEGYVSGRKTNLLKAAVDTVKEWRTDRMLRDLEAMMIVGDSEQLLIISGNGEVIMPDDNVLAVGSGGTYAQAAALALLRHSDMDAEAIVRAALAIAADIDIYTSGNATVLSVGGSQENPENDDDNSNNDSDNSDDSNNSSDDSNNSDDSEGGQADDN